MKICHVTSAHKPEDVRIYTKECVSLSNHGYDVFLVEQGSSYEKEGVVILGLGEAPKSRRDRMGAFAKLAIDKALSCDADVYHLHDPELLRYALKLKRAGKKVVFDSHEFYSGTIKEKSYIPKPFRHIAAKVYSAYEKNVCKRIDGVICASGAVVEYFRQFCNNVELITNFPIISDKPHPTYDERVIIYAGGISEQWNHDVIVKAIADIPEVTYVLCGRVSDSYLNKLKSLPGWNKVDYRGIVPHSEVPELMSSARIGMALLQPGLNTDKMNGNYANTKVFEEMMAGLPVVCTEFKLWKKFVDEYGCGICVNPRDVVQVKKAIIALLEDRDMCQNQGSAGRKAIEERFNWAIEEKKLLSFYSKF